MSVLRLLEKKIVLLDSNAFQQWEGMACALILVIGEVSKLVTAHEPNLPVFIHSSGTEAANSLLAICLLSCYRGGCEE